jgi:RNA 3'-terminal phosphate cyclase (ATP)
MLEMDGSYGEGGGQLVRTSIALSAITGRSIRITNIRKNRKNPGLKQQHLKALETAARICEAQVSGLFPGSTELSFVPMKIKGGKYEIDIGTAGSVTLLLQCLMPVLPFAKENVELTIRGGTDVAWSPTVDYKQQVTLKALEQMGYAGRIILNEYGYYPKGGGKVSAFFEPCKLRGYHYLNEKEDIRGISHASNLPAHIPIRQAEAARIRLLEAGYTSQIETKSFAAFSTGSGITLWAGYLGGSAFGKRGLPAEQVGKYAAEEIISEKRARASVDIHLADQLIPYMALAGNSSYIVRELSQHTLTNIWVVEQFLDIKFKIEEKEGLFKVSVD